MQTLGGLTRSSTAGFVVLLALLTGCTSVGPDEPTADTAPRTQEGSVTTGTAGPSEPSQTTAPCIPTVVLDEYGFPIEIDGCEQGHETPNDDPNALIARIPESESRRSLDAAFGAARRLTTICADHELWSELAHNVSDGVAATAALVRADPELAPWRASVAARALGTEFRNRLVLQEGCQASAATSSNSEPLDDALVGRLAQAAGRLAGANDDLWDALSGAEHVPFGSEFWFNSTHAGHLIDILQDHSENPVDVLMIGASTAARGFDPLALSSVSARTVYNASADGLPPELQIEWYETLLSIGVRPATVVLGLNTWIEFGACDVPQQDKIDSAAALRERAFATLPALADLPSALRIVGGRSPSYQGRALDVHQFIWQDDGQGFALIPEEYDAAIAAFQVGRFEDLPYGPLCDNRLATERALLERFSRDGADVVVVVLPTSDAMADLHPDGRSGHDMVVDVYREMTSALGVELVDLSDAVPDEEFADLTHVTSLGRNRITEALTPLLASDVSG